MSPNRSQHDYAQQRLAYASAPFAEVDLAPTPLAQFEQWYSDALVSRVIEPNAMTISTVDDQGRPTARNVLLKAADERGFSFFTNYGSRKARQIGANPHVALVFSWLELHRQICVIGTASRVERVETEQYFRSRPWGSRIGAWASHQSEPSVGQNGLRADFEVFAERWPDTGSPDDVPLPDHWGGFLIRAREIEFWQGRLSRLHDRLVFTAPSDGAMLDDASAWQVLRRQP